MQFDKPDTAAGAEVAREEVHFRRIDMRAYRRSDGLFEVEGRCRTPSPTIRPGQRGSAGPGRRALHDMGVRLVYDDQLMIPRCIPPPARQPTPKYAAGGLALQSLKGVRMTSGWSRGVRARVGIRT